MLAAGSHGPGGYDSRLFSSATWRLVRRYVALHHSRCSAHDALGRDGCGGASSPNSCSGKTSLIVRFTDDTFNEDDVVEIDQKDRTLEVDGKEVKILIVRTCAGR